MCRLSVDTTLVAVAHARQVGTLENKRDQVEDTNTIDVEVPRGKRMDGFDVKMGASATKGMKNGNQLGTMHQGLKRE